MTGAVIFRLVNFFILAYALLRIMGKALRQFFFARRMRIRKQMVESIMALQVARTKEAKSRRDYEGLPEDISARRSAVAKRTEEECTDIKNGARSKSAHIVDEAARLAAEERAKAVRDAKRDILDEAFALAEKHLVKRAGAQALAAYAERGLHELKRECGRM